MLDSVFGEGHIAFKAVFALIVVIGLLALAFWALRRFGGDRLGSPTSRGRQPRLAVIDAASGDEVVKSMKPDVRQRWQDLQKRMQEATRDRPPAPPTTPRRPWPGTAGAVWT